MSPTRAPRSCARRLDACPPNASWPKRTAPTWRRCLAGGGPTSPRTSSTRWRLSHRPAARTRQTSPPGSTPTRPPPSRCPWPLRLREHEGEEATRPALPRRREHSRRDRPAGGARRDGCRARDRSRPRRSHQLPRRACLAGARDRARPLPRAGASRRADVRSGRARAGSDEARRQPPVQRRDAARRRESRRPADRRALVRDGAARGRGPFLRRARDEGLRGGLGTGSAGRRAHRFSSGFAERVPAAAERRLRAGRVSPARGAARRLCASQGRRRSRVRAPTEAAAELARAGRARLARAGGRGARADRPRACNARRGARARGVRGADTRTRMTRAPATAKLNLALVVGRAHDGRHELTTVYQRLDLVDRVAVAPAPRLRVSGFPEDTLVRNALEGLAAAAGVPPRWEARLTKRIPVAAGLGGGSSDAATALRLANETLDEPLV